MNYIEFNPANIKYLTGIDFSFAVMVILKNKKYLFADPRYHEKSSGLKGINIVRCENVFKDLKTFLKEKKVCELNADLNYIPLKTKNDYLKGIKLKHNDFISVKRSVKKLAEIKKIKKACSLAALSVKKSLTFLKNGISEKEFARLLKINALRLGADGVSFEPIVLFGKNTSVIHGTPSAFKLKKNAPVLIDFGVKSEGYSSDLTRTFYYGKAPLKFKKVFMKVKSALKQAEKTAELKKKCALIDAYAKEKLLPYELAHSLGHGIGLQTHELPYINKKSPHRFKNNMTFTIEPGIYIEGEFGVRLENTYLMEKGQAVNLTNLKLSYEL